MATRKFAFEMTDEELDQNIKQEITMEATAEYLKRVFGSNQLLETKKRRTHVIKANNVQLNLILPEGIKVRIRGVTVYDPERVSFPKKIMFL